MMVSDAARQLSYIARPLDQFRLDPDCTEICINKPHEVFVRTNGKFTRHETSLDYDDCYDIAVLAGALNQQNVGADFPLVGTDLPDGERLQAVLPPCVPSGTVSLTMRVHDDTVYGLEQATSRYNTERWNRWQARKAARRADYVRLLAAYDSGDINLFFRECQILKMNMILCGPTGAGKSTFLRTLVSIVGEYERILTIENALELKIVNQPNHVRLLYSHGDQSVAHVTQEQLLQAYLRMRPDRGYVGELRDANAVYTFIMEGTTGHPGSASTIHGRTAGQAGRRLFNLFKASEEGRSYEPEMVIAQLGLSIDVIVPFNETSGSYEIGEVWFGADAERRGKTFAELLEE